MKYQESHGCQDSEEWLKSQSTSVSTSCKDLHLSEGISLSLSDSHLLHQFSPHLGGWGMEGEVGGWRMEVGGWRMEGRGWRMEDGD